MFRPAEDQETPAPSPKEDMSMLDTIDTAKTMQPERYRAVFSQQDSS